MGGVKGEYLTGRTGSDLVQSALETPTFAGTGKWRRRYLPRDALISSRRWADATSHDLTAAT